MKLFIWCRPYKVSYGDSLVFAVAENLEEAKKAAANGKSWMYGQYDNGGAKCELGEPSRILEAPCAEWQEWSE